MDYEVIELTSYVVIVAISHDADKAIGCKPVIVFIERATNAFTVTNVLDFTDELGKIEHVGCHRAPGEEISCAFIGPDRKFIHVKINYSTAGLTTQTTVINRYLAY